MPAFIINTCVFLLKFSLEDFSFLMYDCILLYCHVLYLLVFRICTKPGTYLEEILLSRPDPRPPSSLLV